MPAAVELRRIRELGAGEDLLRGDGPDQIEEGAGHRCFAVVDVVGQRCFFSEAAGGEEAASGNRFGRHLGEHAGRLEDRHLLSERGQHVAGVALPAMVRVHADMEYEVGRGLPLGRDQDSDRIGSGEGDHATAGPKVDLSGQPFHVVDGEPPRYAAGADVAAVEGLDDQGDVVGAAEAVRGQVSSRSGAYSAGGPAGAPTAPGMDVMPVGSWSGTRSSARISMADTYMDRKTVKARS